MIEDLQEHVCAIKLNFHIILPLSGKELAEINRVAHSCGLQCIADIKLNDIENTNAVAIVQLMGKMGFDSVIANPFIGSNALQDLVEKARKSDGGVIALVYMSHPGAEEGYGLEVESKRKLYRIFMERASVADADGIVIGSSHLQIIKEMSGRRLAVYSPGIGAQGGDAVMRAYKERFQAGRETQPHTLLCCFVICAPTDDEAERRAKVVDYRRVEMAYNRDTPVPTLEQALARTYTEREVEYIQQQRGRLVHGSPARCKEKLLALADQYSADELMIITITGSYETRLESYELLAKAFAT